jgi:hypothetical protein
MAVDRKADYVGNHGGAYTDIEGMSRQFTTVDHDKKTKISTGSISDKELQTLKQDITDEVERAILEILALPAVNVLKNGDGLYEEFIVRKMPEQRIEWNEPMVRNACKINFTLRYNMWNTVWKGTVKEQYWFEDMSHEDILAGKWKELM